MKTINPSNKIKRVKSEISLIFEIISDFHKIKLKSGDKNNSIEGIPSNPCNLSGYGKMAAPNIEKEKVKSNNTGIVLRPICLQVLKSPIMNSMLKNEVRTNPNVNMC